MDETADAMHYVHIHMKRQDLGATLKDQLRKTNNPTYMRYNLFYKTNARTFLHGVRL